MSNMGLVGKPSKVIKLFSRRNVFLKHKLELGGFGCLQFSKRQNTGLGDIISLWK